MELAADRFFQQLRAERGYVAVVEFGHHAQTFMQVCIEFTAEVFAPQTHLCGLAYCWAAQDVATPAYRIDLKRLAVVTVIVVMGLFPAVHAQHQLGMPYLATPNSTAQGENCFPLALRDLCSARTAVRGKNMMPRHGETVHAKMQLLHAARASCWRK